MAAYLLTIKRRHRLRAQFESPGLSMAPRFDGIVFWAIGALMRHLIEYARNKLDDPVLVTWALDRYEHAQLRGSDLCRCMEEAWFDDLALQRWIDRDDHEVLAELFRVLPSHLFANLRPGIIDRWSTWSGQLGARATTVLIGGPLEAAFPLIARHIECHLLDYPKTVAIIAALPRFPSAEASRLLADLTGRILELKDARFAMRLLLHALLRPTAVLDHGNLLRLIETCARAAHNDKTEWDQLLRAIYAALFADDALLEKAEDLIEARKVQPLRSLQALFSSGAPLQECDRILAAPDPWPDAKAFLDQHRAASASTEIAFAVIKTLESLGAADRSKMACFAVAVVLEAFALAEIDASVLSMEQALDLLALDLSENRHAWQLTQRLRAFSPLDTARAVSDRMSSVQDEWGGVHLAILAGELRLVEAIPILIDCLRRGEFLGDAAQKSLVQIGEPAERALIAQWDELDSSQKIFGHGTLEQIGGELTGRFAIERFQELFRDDHESWCELAEAVPSERLVNLLEPEVRRKQPIIDECFYRLCVLTGREANNLKEIGERVRAYRRGVLERRWDFAASNLRKPNDTIPLTLKCERCGDVNRYEVKSIITGEHGALPYFIGDDLRCASCGRWADFEFTGRSQLQLVAAMIEFAAGRAVAKGERKTPLQPTSAHYRGETRPAPEVMAELKAAVAEHPQNIVNHLRLARFQHIFGRRGRAAECYGRALELAPDSFEAGLGIANVMADAGELRIAYDRLSELLQRQSQWRFFRTDELSPGGLIDDFVQLFNKLHSALGIHDEPPLRTALAQRDAKIGRNDPCPCGSGKKYKKCCGDSCSSAAYSLSHRFARSANHEQTPGAKASYAPMRGLSKLRTYSR